MNHMRVVEELIHRYDLNNETEKKKAYLHCERYGKKHFKARVEFNAFMQLVSEKLGILPTRSNDFSDTVGEVPERAKLYLTYKSKTGPELTGNAEGLRYLAALVTELANQAVEHDHAHLYADELPMCGKTFPLTIYHEPDAWFEKLSQQDRAEDVKRSDIKMRDVRPAEIVALCLLGEIPPEMLLTRFKPYRVLAVDPHEGQEVWEKYIRDSRERFCLFTIVNDNGVQERFGFDLDDPEVLFFTRQDVARLTAGESAENS